MATIERVEFIDDLDGKPIAPDDLNRIEFEVKLPGRRTARYGLDLRTTNVAKFERDITKYIDKATKIQTNGRAVTGKVSSGSGASKDQIRAIRAWAQENSYEVSDRGRLPAEVIEAFDAAH